jgi:hypothetical protein
VKNDSLQLSQLVSRLINTIFFHRGYSTVLVCEVEMASLNGIGMD